MRIAFFVQSVFRQGTFFRWHNLAIALKQMGNIVHVYANDFNRKGGDRQEEIDGVLYDIVSETIFNKVFYSATDPLNAYKRWNKQYPTYDVVHLFQPFLSAYVPWNKIRKRNDKTLCIYDWDDLWTNGLFKEANDLRTKWVHYSVAWLEKKLPQQANGTTVCSGYLQNLLPASATSRVLYNGFWPKKNWPDKVSLQEKWKMHSDTFHLSYIGKTAGELAWIAAGFQAAKTAGLSVQLWIAGPDEAVVQEAGLWAMEDVHYMGMLTVDEAASLAGASDLGLIPLEDNAFNQSRFPIKFFDYLSVATPVYYSAVGELAIAGKNQIGAYAGPASQEAWIQQLPATIAAIQAAPPKISLIELEAAYAWPAVAEQLIQFYKQLATA